MQGEQMKLKKETSNSYKLLYIGKEECVSIDNSQK